MALEAMNELKRRGFKVPENIAVTGFDDIYDSLYSVPSLSTVSQSIDKQSFKAMQLLHSALDGEIISDVTNIQTSICIRQSCGCAATFPQSD